MSKNLTNTYAELTTETIAERLGHIDLISQRIGHASTWSTKEVGDGNLNLVFIVTGNKGQIIVKQALPYVRVFGDSWPLDVRRAFFEYEALKRQNERASHYVPDIYHFDEAQAILVMEFLTPHIILRHSLKDAIQHKNLGNDLGIFCARTLFSGSDYHIDTAVCKADMVLFADNVELCKITEDLVFTDPYYDADSNNYNHDLLGNVVESLWADGSVKLVAQEMKTLFATKTETLLHGDLHAGSIMVTDTETMVIDPEFAIYGPMGFDIGMLIGNFFMAYFAQQGYATPVDNRHDYERWILDTVATIQSSFEQEFTRLWIHERNGMLYPKELFEDQGHEDFIRKSVKDKLQTIWHDTLGFAGVEMIRRTIGFAHVMEIDDIANDAIRTDSQTKIIKMAKHLLLNRHTLTIDDTLNIARKILK